MEPNVFGRRRLLFGPNRHLRRRGNNLLFSSFPKGRTAFSSSHGFGRRRSHHGCGGKLVFLGKRFSWAASWNRAVASWFVPPADARITTCAVFFDRSEPNWPLGAL